VTDFETIRHTAFEIEGPPEGSLEARASVALKILAVLGFSGVVLAMFPGKTPVATLLTVAFNIAAAVLATILLGVAVGLDRRRSWAAAAVRPLLVLLIVSGVATMAVAWSEGLTRIPFDVALAAWALLGPADVTPLPSQERRSVALAGAALVALAVMLSSKPLFSWGGVFDVHEPDLRVALAADCATTGTSPPDRITLNYEWSWTSTTPLPSGTDIVVIGWTGSDALGRPLYGVDRIPVSGAGVYSGLPGYPSTAMADDVARESQGSFRWALPLDEQQFAPGRIELLLRLARAAPEGPAPLTITATYVHLGIWRHAAATVTCAW
jgi:hypothetical protein